MLVRSLFLLAGLILIGLGLMVLVYILSMALPILIAVIIGYGLVSILRGK